MLMGVLYNIAILCCVVKPLYNNLLDTLKQEKDVMDCRMFIRRTGGVPNSQAPTDHKVTTYPSNMLSSLYETGVLC